VADRNFGNIYQVDAASGATAQLLPFGTAMQTAAVAYDPTAKLVYWTDTVLCTINRYSLITNSSTVIYRDPYITGKDNLVQVRWIFTVCIQIFITGYNVHNGPRARPLSPH